MTEVLLLVKKQSPLDALVEECSPKGYKIFKYGPSRLNRVYGTLERDMFCSWQEAKLVCGNKFVPVLIHEASFSRGDESYTLGYDEDVFDCDCDTILSKFSEDNNKPIVFTYKLGYKDETMENPPKYSSYSMAIKDWGVDFRQSINESIKDGLLKHAVSACVNDVFNITGVKRSTRNEDFAKVLDS